MGVLTDLSNESVSEGCMLALQHLQYWVCEKIANDNAFDVAASLLLLGRSHNPLTRHFPLLAGFEREWVPVTGTDFSRTGPVLQ